MKLGHLHKYYDQPAVLMFLGSSDFRRTLESDVIFQ